MQSDRRLPVSTHDTSEEDIDETGKELRESGSGSVPHDHMIDFNRPPVSDQQILIWLMDDEKRAVEDNPDCPPYDPKSGL